MTTLTHIDATGAAHMVDVSDKVPTDRVAIAEGRIVMQAATLDLALSGQAKKGDVVATARIAGIMAAKRTSELIPLCHPLALTKVQVDIEADAALPGFRVSAFAKVTGKTGVEMEALTAVSVRLPHTLRHAESGGPGHAHRRHRPAREARRQVGRLDP